MTAKLQTSLEFLLVLSVIGILIAGALGVYGSEIKGQRAILGSMLRNGSGQANPRPGNYSSNGIFGYIIYVPINSTAGSQNIMQAVFYGCTNGTAKIGISSDSVVFSRNVAEVEISNIGIANVQFEPIKSGVNKINLTYYANCSGAHSGNETLTTYSAYPSLLYSNGSSAGAYIASRNETEIYMLSNKAGIYSIETWYHCTYHDFWGNPLPVGAQCGTEDAWDYRQFSDYCYTNNLGTTSTTCIAPVWTGYNLSQISQSPSNYAYNFTLFVTLPGNKLSTAISSQKNSSEFYIGNTAVGNAKVLWVGSSDASPSISIIQNATNSSLANNTAYYAYVQAKNNMYAELSYYNSSGISGSMQAIIQQSIDAYLKSVSSLMASRQPVLSSCKVYGTKLECKPSHALSYYINASIVLPVRNSTIEYEGSTINIFGA